VMRPRRSSSGGGLNRASSALVAELTPRARHIV
jgi:hypothetical protein